MLKKPILQLDSNNNIIGEILFYNQIKEMGFTYQNVYSTIKGYQKTHKGYKFCYKKDYIKQKVDDSNHILKLNINGDIIYEYKKLKDVIYDYHTESGVYKAITGYNSNHHGYLWMYKKDFSNKNVNKLIDKYMNAEDMRIKKMLKTKKEKIREKELSLN